MFCQKITLVGVGLLGGSLGLALKARRLVGTVAGYVRRPASIQECERLGAVDRATLDLREAVTGADVVVLCTPLAQMRGLVEQLLPVLKAEALVTDVGSVKGSVVRDLEPLVSHVRACFVGSHPMAGAEKMGVAHARADLFEDAVCAITPTENTPPEAVRRVNELWESVGGRTLRLDPDRHDELVCRSSHLPHVVAAELANYVLNPTHTREQILLCANGFRDSTRIAAGSPEMWRDIALANRQHLFRVLGVFIENLQGFRDALANSDERAIADFFASAKQRRDLWCAQNGSPE